MTVFTTPNPYPNLSHAGIHESEKGNWLNHSQSRPGIIIGASRGIGRALALECARQDAMAMVGAYFYRSPKEALGLQAMFPENIYLFPFDVRNFDAVHHAFESFYQVMGGIDVIINNVGVGAKRQQKPLIVPFKPTYTNQQRIKIVVELLVIIAIQTGIYLLTGQKLWAYLWAGPFAYLFASTILMVYIFTNHFLNPICEVSDPLLTTTTVQVPSVFNWLHHNFAYHTEHHIFPGMNSDYYPELSRILKEKYPDRYNFLPIKHAWKKLWQNEDFLHS